MLVIATPYDRSTWNFQRLVSVRVSIKLLYLIFYIGDPGSGQFCNLFITNQWEKNERRLFWTKTTRTLSKHRFTIQLDLTTWVGILRPVTTRHVAKVISGHERSPEVFSAITLDRDQLKRWKHHKCVHADDTDRLICKMTFSDQVNFQNDFLSQISLVKLAHSTRFDKKNTMLAKQMTCLY